MWRFALIAYLCLATVMGPGLCCCSVVRISHAGATRRHSCCDHSRAASAEIASSSHRHDASHRSSQVARVRTDNPAAATLASARSGSVPSRQQDRHSCPCNHQRSGTMATAVAKVNIAAELNGLSGHLLGYDLPPAFVANVCDLSTRSKVQLSNGPPAELAGRGILRAYQILLC